MRNALLFHRREDVCQRARQRETGIRRDLPLFGDNFHPRCTFDPGHQRGVGEIRILTQERGVLLWNKHGARANLQARQLRERGEFVFQRSERGKAIARLEDFKRAVSIPASELIYYRFAPFLSVWHSRRGGVFSDMVLNICYANSLIDLEHVNTTLV